MKAKLSQYLKAGQSLGFDPRSRQARRTSALPARLNSRRLRGVMSMWRRHVSAVDLKDPVLGPVAGVCRLAGRVSSRPRPPTFSVTLTARKDPKAAPVHPLVAKVVLAEPAGEHGRGGRPIRVAVRTARNALEGTSGEGEGRARSAALPEPEWESLRKAIFGDGGPLAINNDGMRFILDQGQRDAAREVECRDPADQRDGPRVAAAGDGGQRRAQAGMTRTCSCGAIRGGRGRRSRGGSSRCSRARTAPAFQKGSGRLELAQAIASASNPLTARVFVNRVWLWHFGKGLVDTRQRLRSAQRPAVASRAARLPGRRVHQIRLVDQSLAPADHALEHVPAAKRAAAGRAGARP